MKLKDFQTLKKLMARTTSESDPEALTSMRMANAILAKENLTWERVLDRTVTVVAEFEPGPDEDAEEEDQRKAIEEAFEKVFSFKMAPSFHDFMMSLKDQWDKKGSLTPLQIDALMKAAKRS